MHKCFISFKTRDIEYKKYIQDSLNVDMIDKSLNESIDSNDEDYIMKKIRLEYLYDSTVTICLIGSNSGENALFENQAYIKRELQASLYDNAGNGKRNGVLGVVLPEMTDKIYKGKYLCDKCGEEHNYVNINNDTTIKEFNYNYYLPNPSGCAWSESDRYCVLVKWDDFCNDPNKYIDMAYEKRNSDIVKKVKVFPK